MKRITSVCLMLLAAVMAMSQTVSRVEYYWDTDPGRGRGTAITGVTGSNMVTVNTSISTAGLSPGIHTLGLRSRSNSGMWSATGIRQVVVGPQISRVEYFYDLDPGLGEGLLYPTTEMSGSLTIDNAQFSATGIGDGYHRLGIRAQAGTNGMWSPTYWQEVLVNAAGISQIEYFYDTDPGFDSGIAYTAFTPSATVNINSATLSATGISDGYHRLGIRAKSAGNGMWSPTYWQEVLVNAAGISQIEYFYDTDPGFDSGIAYTAFTPSATVNINSATLSATGIGDGYHRLGIRAKSAGNGMWSPTYWQEVLVNAAGISQIEYFYDTDPGFDSGTAFTAFTPGTTVNINSTTLSAAGIGDGYHRLGIRAKSAGNGMWSPTYWQEVLVNNAGISQVEYYWDSPDPGYGNALAYTGFTPGTSVVAMQQLSTASLSTGMHQLALRAKSQGGYWSPTYFHDVFVGKGADYAEYFWDSDPGFGLGTAIPFVSDTVVMVSLENIAVPTSDGLHVLFIRTRAGKIWSPTYTKEYCNAPTPSFSILGGDTVCQNEQVIILDESDGTSALTQYTWDMQSDGTTDYTITGDLTHTYTQAGIYTLTLGVGNNATCQNTYSRTIMVRSTQSPTISISRSKSSICEGEEVRFVATTQRAADYNPTIEWYRNDTLMAGLTADTIFLSDLRQGDRIRAKVRVNNPCATADSAISSQLSMTVYSLPVVTMRHYRYIFNDEAAFTLASRFTATPTGGTYYINGIAATLFNPSRNSDGRYEISYTVTNNRGCATTVVDTFELCPRVTFTLVAQSDDAQHGSVSGGGQYTIGDTATVTATPAASWRFHHWNDGDTTNPRRIEMTSNVTLTAYWERLCQDIVIDDTVEACDSYVWHGNTYTASNYTATHTVPSALGCDSTHRLQLTLNHSNSAVFPATACDSYAWHGTTYTASTNTPTYTCENVAGCDSVTTLHLTLGHSNSAVFPATSCDSYVWHGNTYTASTNTPTYTCENVSGCDSVTTLHLTLNRSNSAVYTASACDSYVWHGNTYTASTNTPTYTCENVSGCDSVTTLHLTLGHSNTATETVTVCDSYVWHGNTYTATTNTPTYTCENVSGCDSVTTLHLTLNHSNSAVYTATACDSYVWHGNTYTASTNTPTFTCENVSGCDSLTTLHLTLGHSNTATETVTACDSYAWNGTTYTASTNSPTYTCENVSGCDSVTTLHLTLGHSNTATETVIACNSYVWHGITYTASTNAPTYTCENVSGCDSVTTLHLTIEHCSSTHIVACDNYQWNGTTYTASGTFVHGTDTLYLTINRSNSAVYTATACDSYVWHGTTYTASTNTATYTCENVSGCDSVTTLHLTLNNSNSAVYTATACDSYVWHGTTYTASTNTATYTCENVSGCDSVTTLHLTLGHSNTATETVTACDSYAWHGTTYTATTNTPTYTCENVSGCDSVTTLHLTLGHSNTATETVTACDSYAWHGTTYTATTNTPTYTCENVSGCDSVTTLHLTLGHSNTAIEAVTACNSYVWHGTTYSASTNTPTYTCENVSGCDSVTTLHLTIEHCTSTHIAACDSYQWNGSTYTSSGMYVYGTDTLYLTINHSNSAVFTATACDSYVWHGTTYSTSTNTPTYTCDNVSGCDSVTTLHLTLGHSNTAIEAVTACNSYEWHGTTYTASTNTATYTCQNVSGCDSVTTLHLTIEHCSSSYIVACDSYQWNGTTYTTSGMFVNGTDTLYLTINHSNSAVYTATACDSYEWHGTTYTVSTNTPTYTCENMSGCDSVTTLHLTIHYSKLEEESQTIYAASFMWHNMICNASGDYSDTLSTIWGCDSIVTLHLTLISTAEIHVTSNDEFMGTVSGSGQYHYGDTAILTAYPVEHYHFDAWNDGNTDNPRMVRVNGDSSFVAYFSIDIHRITVLSNDMSLGTVEGTGNYEYGSQATISAHPNSGAQFVGWDNGVTYNPYSFTVTNSDTIVAIFSDDVGIEAIGNQWEVTVQPNPTNGMIALMQGGSILNEPDLLVEIFSMRGVCRKTTSPLVDLTDLPAGCYLLRVTTLKGVSILKVVKR